MSKENLFRDYDTLRRSGLFDAGYYLAANPEVAAQNLDPLLHYLERGAAERRGPSPGFDTAFYLEQCRRRGESPSNPLLHYVLVGAKQGLQPHPQAATPVPAPSGATLQDAGASEYRIEELFISTQGAVRVAGWALWPAPIQSLAVLIDGTEVGAARIGLERPDVARAYAQHTWARHSGFAFRRRLKQPVASGMHVLTLRASFQGTDARQDMSESVQVSLDEDPARIVKGVNLPVGDEDRTLCVEVPALSDGKAKAAVTGNLILSGWALARSGIATIELAIDGRPLGRAQHGLGRIDVGHAFSDRPEAARSGFALFVPHRALPKGPHVARVTLTDGEGERVSVEFSVSVEDLPDDEGPWSLRRKIPRAEANLQRQILEGLRWRPRFLVRIRMPGTQEGARRAAATLTSLLDQTYAHWRAEVISTGDARGLPGLRRQLLALAPGAADRLRVVCASGLRDSAGKGSAGRAGAEELLWCLAAGDTLGADALAEMAIASGQDRDADFFYCDERRPSPVAGRAEAFFKPDWSPDLLLSTNYIGRSWVARRDLLRRAGIGPVDAVAHGDYDTVLRATEACAAIRHVPKLLVARDAKGLEGAAAERKALARALARRGAADARVEDGCAPGIFRIRRPAAGQGKVSIIIPTCGAQGHIKGCLESLREVTAYRDFEILCIENIPSAGQGLKKWLRDSADQVIAARERFNWSRFNNRCAQRASGEFLLFLNDDVRIVEPDWLDVLVGHARRREVGVVGPRLLYPDGSVQHAGLALAGTGKARHIFRHSRADDPGYFGLSLTERNVIGVTGACLMTRREVFEALGRFDEAHSIINNDLDYCLRAWERGYVNVYSPHATLVHHELASRGDLGDRYDGGSFAKRWSAVFSRGDPYLNPNLCFDVEDLAPDREAVKTVCAGHPLLSPADVRRVLIVKLDHIGDCITSIPAVRRLKEVFPRARFSVLANRATRAIWALEPAIDEFLELDYFHARSGLGKKGLGERELLELRKRLAALRFDLAVDLRKSPDAREVLRFTGARVLAGFDYQAQYPWLDIALEWEGDRQFVHKRSHVADDLLALAEAVATSCFEARSFLRPDRSAKLSLSGTEQRRLFAKPVICVHPASGNAMRQWPARRFAELIELLLGARDVHVAVIGGPQEADLAREVVDAVARKDAVHLLAGRMPLEELPALLARCALFVGNNSGPKHLAAALGVPTIGVHSGVVDANEWGPLGERAVAIRRDMACSPCYAETPADCPHNLACLHGLAPGAVFREALRMLAIGR
jgi:ADP-heptose:LPS heptosyltransferase/GT2 family glycosyltransferase